ncbi:peptidoglycan DD-metalloendopeptidase family protein [Sorangium cellulosum]|uniref:peptidoglycan DD-metalloendopeptidase family protein n=1 Tax=Sorangium cellulosum TaxID=56 RepID=UPI003D9A4F7E
MTTIKQFSTRTVVCGAAAAALACAAGCVAADPVDGHEHELGGPEEEAIASAAEALVARELSVLVLGGDFPVTNAYRPAGGHAGIDFGGTGDGVTAVRSPVEGTVAAKTGECGKVAVFDGNHTIILAHMVELTGLVPGDRVEVGTYLGKASRTVGGGCTATGAHLHMEIRTGRNTYMAAPARDNRATTLDPLTYSYGPFAPVALLAPADGAEVPSAVTFRWEPRQGATAYRLQVSAVNGFDEESCLGGCAYEERTGGTSVTLSLTPGTTYFWRVRAGNAATAQGGRWSPVRSARVR